MRIALLLTLISSLAAAPCAAATPSIPAFRPIVTTYDVYVGGVHFITADILFQEQRDKYRARVATHTYGVWHRLLPWDSDLDARGAIRQDHLIPAEYDTTNTFRTKVKVTRLRFMRDGDIKSEFEPPSNDANRNEITLDQKRGALDPVTALLQMLAYLAVEKSCDVTVPIYDGKRRFDITAQDAGHEEIDEEDYGIYKGDARVCAANFKSIAGDWKGEEKDKFWKMNKGEDRRPPFHIWLGNISPDLPELPVKLDSGSVWGLIVMHLTTWHYATPDDLKS